MKFTIYQESRPGKRPTNEDRIAYSYSRDARSGEKMFR